MAIKNLWLRGTTCSLLTLLCSVRVTTQSILSRLAESLEVAAEKLAEKGETQAEREADAILAELEGLAGEQSANLSFLEEAEQETATKLLKELMDVSLDTLAQGFAQGDDKAITKSFAQLATLSEYVTGSFVRGDTEAYTTVANTLATRLESISSLITQENAKNITRFIQDNESLLKESITSFAQKIIPEQTEQTAVTDFVDKFYANLSATAETLAENPQKALKAIGEIESTITSNLETSSGIGLKAGIALGLGVPAVLLGVIGAGIIAEQEAIKVAPGTTKPKPSFSFSDIGGGK